MEAEKCTFWGQFPLQITWYSATIADSRRRSPMLLARCEAQKEMVAKIVDTCIMYGRAMRSCARGLGTMMTFELCYRPEKCRQNWACYDKFRDNTLKSTRKEAPAPYATRPPLKFLVIIMKNWFSWIEATPKNVFDGGRFLSLLHYIYTSHLRFSFRFGHSSHSQTF